MEDGYITYKELELLAATPTEECQLCDDILSKLKRIASKNGKMINDLFFVDKSDYEDFEIKHLEQVIARKVYK